MLFLQLLLHLLSHGSISQFVCQSGRTVQALANRSSYLEWVGSRVRPSPAEVLRAVIMIDKLRLAEM